MYAGKGHDKRAKWLVSGMEEENQKSKVELTMEKGRIISVAEFLSPDELYEDLIRRVKKYHPSGDITLIEKAYEKAIDEETELVIQKREEQTNAEVEKLQEQISKLKDVKDKGQKEANKAEIKEIEKRIKILKDSSKKDIARIKEESKEKKDAYKKGMQEIEKAGLDVIKKATNDIEKEYESRKDSIVEEYQSQKDAILSLQDDLYSKTSEYGELFQ